MMPGKGAVGRSVSERLCFGPWHVYYCKIRRSKKSHGDECKSAIPVSTGRTPKLLNCWKACCIAILDPSLSLPTAAIPTLDTTRPRPASGLAYPFRLRQYSACVYRIQAEKLTSTRITFSRVLARTTQKLFQPRK